MKTMGSQSPVWLRKKEYDKKAAFSLNVPSIYRHFKICRATCDVWLVRAWNKRLIITHSLPWPVQSSPTSTYNYSKTNTEEENPPLVVKVCLRGAGKRNNSHQFQLGGDFSFFLSFASLYPQGHGGVLTALVLHSVCVGISFLSVALPWGDCCH